MDNREVYFSSAHCDIFYNQQLHTVETKWTYLFFSSNELKKILDAIIDLLILKKASVVIADARLMGVISKDDQQWIVDSWYPRAVKAGFRYEALILKKNTFNELTVQKIVNHYDEQKVTTAYFSDYAGAVAWDKKNVPI